MRKTLCFTALAAVLSTAALAATPDVPEAVRPPSGHKMTLHTVGVGEITYECRLKAGATDAHEWAFVSPVAMLTDKSKKPVGKYYAGPTWEAADGSKVTGKQVAVAPAAPGNIPLQLVKAEPATGNGAMSGVTYIQRLNTQGGVAPADPCTAATVGAKKQVLYQADYLFYKM
jgi:hypothetical protein